jgi:hypothetical protein
MAVSRSLRRLLHIRELEEEQCRLALETGQGELNRLENALVATEERDRRGRKLLESSIHSGELPDRLAGLEEMRASTRRTAVLVPRIAKARLYVGMLRQTFLSKRVERRQADSLIQEAEARDAIEAGRRSQQSLDDWYSNRLHRSQGVAELARRADSLRAAAGPDGGSRLWQSERKEGQSERKEGQSESKEDET